MSDNSVTLIGNLTQEPTLRFSDSGNAVVSVGLAVNRRYQAGGQWQESTSYYTVTVFGKIAEDLAASATKGTRVIVIGHIETGEFTDKEGVNRKTFKIIASEIGASFRFATATIDRVARDTAGQQGTQPYRPAVDKDEEPF
jgi:single-strand DNA-binding protein